MADGSTVERRRPSSETNALAEDGGEAAAACVDDRNGTPQWSVADSSAKADSEAMEGDHTLHTPASAASIRLRCVTLGGATVCGAVAGGAAGWDGMEEDERDDREEEVGEEMGCCTAGGCERGSAVVDCGGGNRGLFDGGASGEVVPPTIRLRGVAAVVAVDSVVVRRVSAVA